MKLSKKELDLIILKESNRILFEQDDTVTNATTSAVDSSNPDDPKSDDDMEKYLTDELKRLKTEIDTDNRVKGTLIDPLERKIRETKIKANKDRIANITQLKSELEQKMANQEKETQQQSLNKTNTITNMSNNDQLAEIIDQMVDEEYANSPVMKRSFAEQAPVPSPTPAPTPVQQQPVVQQAPVKKYKNFGVKFDTKTERPFDVKFSERGFSVEGTRLSFELAEKALSKNFNLVLNGGKGLILDAVRLNKILKYKDRGNQ